MKRAILIFFLIFNFLKADEITNELKLIKQEIKLRFEAIERRFETIDKRFEAIDKRFEAIERRFDDLITYMNERFETIENFILALTTGIFGLIAFMIWDRRSIVEKSKEEFEREYGKKILELEIKKADKNYVKKLIDAINEILEKDSMARDIFKKYGLI